MYVSELHVRNFTLCNSKLAQKALLAAFATKCSLIASPEYTCRQACTFEERNVFSVMRHIMNLPEIRIIFMILSYTFFVL